MLRELNGQLSPAITLETASGRFRVQHPQVCATVIVRSEWGPEIKQVIEPITDYIDRVSRRL